VSVIIVGLLIAGLFLMLREGLPLLRAYQTGVIRTRGHRPRDILRADEPERFNGLIKQRLKLAGGAGVLVLAGMGYLLLQVIQAVLRAA
jgi:hypothetical protein